MQRSIPKFAALFCAFSLMICHVASAEEITPKPPKESAQPDAPPKVADPDKAPVPDPDDPTPKKDPRDRYIFPKDADSDALVDFCNQLQDYDPEDDADALLHEKKMPKAIKKACKRILQLEKDLESDNARFARRFILADKLDANPGIDAAKTGPLLDKVRAFLTSPKAAGEDADVAAALADFLGAHVSPISIEWSQKVGKDLAASADPDMASAGKVLLGTARRLNLVGHPLALKGKTLDRKAFDVASLKDKVVLVVFWATWCEHCIHEIPNLKENYDAYHAKGFEIVAISADEDRHDLETFLKDERIPWINLYEKGGKHPAMDEFGINGYPSTILIGKDGNVTALEVRDKALGVQLESILGAPDPAAVAKKEQKNEEPPKKAEPKTTPDDDGDSNESKESLKKKYSF